MCLNKNFFDLLLISFVFYTHNSLEKRAKNSGVLTLISILQWCDYFLFFWRRWMFLDRFPDSITENIFISKWYWHMALIKIFSITSKFFQFQKSSPPFAFFTKKNFLFGNNLLVIEQLCEFFKLVLMWFTLTQQFLFIINLLYYE